MDISEEEESPSPSASPEKGGERQEFIKLASNEYYFPARQRKSSTRSNPTSDHDIHSAPTQEISSLRSLRNFASFSSEENNEDSSEEVEEEEEQEERLASFKDSITKPEDSSDEWEESLLYVDLDDIPSVNELFAVEPDDFLTFQSRKQRELPKAKKDTLPVLQMKFFNLDSPSPILQIGTRYYVGKYEDTVGSALMFQKKEQAGSEASSKRLPSIVPDPVPPRDKVYHEKLRSNKLSEFEMVANVSKVLKMTRKEVRLAGGDLLLLPPTPGGLPPQPPAKFNNVSDTLLQRRNSRDAPLEPLERLKKPGPTGPRGRSNFTLVSTTSGAQSDTGDTPETEGGGDAISEQAGEDRTASTSAVSTPLGDPPAGIVRLI